MIETENLRSRILSLAMRGELSERNLQDGSAAELYSKILETKAELVKSGKIRKDKQYDAIEAENMPYSIPDNWCWVRFGKIINLQSGQDLKPSEYTTSGMPSWDRPHPEVRPEGREPLPDKAGESTLLSIRRGERAQRRGCRKTSVFLSRETGISGNFVGRIKGAKCPFDLQFLTWDFS